MGRGDAVPAWVIKTLLTARKVPWRKVLAAIVWLNVEGRNYWNRLTPEERREVRDIAMKSKGNRSNLSNADLGRLVDLFGKIRKADVASS
jgi:hypothetical protein